MVNHIEHLEDLVLTQGSVGVMKINNYLWSIQHGSAQLTTKYDGAPSIFAGWKDEKFFVSTKSYLNKTPVMYFTQDDINNADIALGLKIKLQYCLRYLPKVVPTSVVLQGDLLFTPGDAKKVDGVVRVHPNTIVYDFPEKWWRDTWRIGVAWHTWYSASGQESHPHFGRLLTTDRVLSIDPAVKNYKIEDDITSGPRDKALDINMEWLNKATSDVNFAPVFKQAYNSFVRLNMLDEINGADWHVKVDENIQRSINELKTEAGRQLRRDRLQPIVNHTSDYNNLEAVLQFMKAVQVSKRAIINSLENHSKIKTGVIDDNGLQPTEHEGYVMIGQSELIKLVDRSRFSHYNFSTSILKGWNEPTRT